jgi:uncharacterized protein
MSRIGKAYEARFRALLLRLRARKLEAGVQWLLRKAGRVAVRTTEEYPRALSQTYERLRWQVRSWERRQHSGDLVEGAPPRFLCDAGLGGLARWLRAAGYEAFWFPDIDDAELLRRASSSNVIVLTTDSLMMERGVLRDGSIPSFWLPPVLKKEEQLALVLREFDLPPRDPRCMACGGELRPVSKESVRERIPPKTWRWIDEYFVCSQCHQLFWRGTHWDRIRKTIEKQRAAQPFACSPWQQGCGSLARE